MFTVAIVECGKYNLLTQASKSFSLQKQTVHIYIREFKGFLNKYADPTISVYFLTKFSTKPVILKKNIVKLISFE
jgi:hypothetical protein